MVVLGPAFVVELLEDVPDRLDDRQAQFQLAGPLRRDGRRTSRSTEAAQIPLAIQQQTARPCRPKPTRVANARHWPSTLPT